MKEDAAARAARYLDAISQSLKRLKMKKLPISVSEKGVNQVLDLIRGYSEDAKHYGEHEKPVTSLACIAYAEGLLDAIKFLGLVDLENPNDVSGNWSNHGPRTQTAGNECAIPEPDSARTPRA